MGHMDGARDAKNIGYGIHLNESALSWFRSDGEWCLFGWHHG